MRVYLTRNVRKEDDYVNGMQCAVEAFDGRTKALRAMTKAGHRLVITPWADAEKQIAVCYPVRA
eukprot:9400121-Alexandrium_andersonii.AAC.1